MHGAVQLVEQQGGTVAGMVAVVMEDNENTAEYRKKYKCVTAIQPNTKWQNQANAQYLESFKTYKPEMAFPK
jgi:adenine phosphoribosyltransferase